MKRSPLAIGLVIALPIGLAIFWFVSNSRAATETPDFHLIRADGKFEIRDYPALIVATTPMSSGTMNGGFGQLFRYITGRNVGAEKIAMTAPVLIDHAPGQPTMSFIMPRQTVARGVPKPAGDEVTLRTVEAARFAVLRFSGGQTTANEQAALQTLTAWLAGQKIPARGKPLFAYYDPPWTPVFLRRNEVMIRVEPPDE